MEMSPASNNNQNRPLIQDEATISIVDLLDNLIYYKWYFILVTILAIALSLAVAIMATPLYTADALVQVEERKGASMIGALDQVSNASFGSQSPVLGEIEIIRSRTVVGRAVERLKSNVGVSVENRIPIIGNWLSRVLSKDEQGLAIAPTKAFSYAWGGERLEIARVLVPQRLNGKPMLLTVAEGRHWVLSLDGTGEVLAQGQGSGELFTGMDGQFQFELGAFLARPGTVFRVVVYSLQSEIRRTLASLSVTEVKRQSNLIALKYVSPNPAFSAAMLNAIGDVYVQQNLERRSAEASKTLQFLIGELPRLRQELDESEQLLNTFRSESRTVDITFELQELLKVSADLQTQKLQLELKQKEMLFRYDATHPLRRALTAQSQCAIGTGAND
jgi:tyrosine-protein kinase Etk/Wzc